MTSWIRSSLRRKGQHAFGLQDRDGIEYSGRVLAETFERHWHQLRGIAAHNTAVPTLDDVVAVVNLLDQMITLLQLELDSEAEDVLSLEEGVGNEAGEAGNDGSQPERDPLSLTDTTSPCLDILLSENIPAHILAASRMPLLPEQQDKLRAQQLKLYETLLAGSSLRAKNLLSHQPFLKPLIELLSEFHRDSTVDDDSNHVDSYRRRSIDMASIDTELHLVMVLNLLCSRLMEKDNSHLLEVFFSVDSIQNGSNNNESSKMSSNPQFLIFSILVNFLHREGLVGQHARDALLLVMSLSKKHEKLGQHIAKNTNFCPVLATGLSGLYSLMPRHLDNHPNFRETTWHQISQNDLPELPEVVAFLSSLHFCDAVVQVAHPSVRQHLLGLIYMGFLVPVLGPALTQSVESELVCSTAYVDLFLRQISEPALLAVFLRFIFTDNCDGKNIIDILIDRIALQSQLSLVTLSLFETFVNLNCEDVMLWLVFRHLIPMQHLIPSQRNTIRQPDLLGRAAEKFLSMTPICCLEAKTMTSPTSQQHNPDSKNMQGPSALPTFLVGMGRSSIEDGLALNSSGDHSMTTTTSSVDFGYNAYLQDARRQVRQRFDATKCWAYDYDGLKPPTLPTLAGSDSTEEDEYPYRRRSRMTSIVDDVTLVNEDHFGDGPRLPASPPMATSPPTSSHPAVTQSIPVVTSTPVRSGTNSGGPMSLTDDEIDRDFWNLMKDASSDSTVVAEARLLQSALRRLHPQTYDNLSQSSGCVSLNSSQDELSPRVAQDALELVTHGGTLGPFLDLLLEKVELMASNDLSTNLIVTNLLSQLATYPQPLLRSVLIHPNVILQPSVRGLFSAIASLRQKLDNIMPTLTGAEEAVQLARKFLLERVTVTQQQNRRRDSNISIMSSISQLGQEARATKNSFSAAFSSMFRRTSGTANVKASEPSSWSHETSPSNAASGRRSMAFSRRLSREVRRHAMAAVILEEWLQELSAIAQEQSVLQKEHSAFQLSLAASLDTALQIPPIPPSTTATSAIITSMETGSGCKFINNNLNSGGGNMLTAEETPEKETRS